MISYLSTTIFARINSKIRKIVESSQSYVQFRSCIIDLTYCCKKIDSYDMVLAEKGEKNKRKGSFVVVTRHSSLQKWYKNHTHSWHTNCHHSGLWKITAIFRDFLNLWNNKTSQAMMTILEAHIIINKLRYSIASFDKLTLPYDCESVQRLQRIINYVRCKSKDANLVRLVSKRLHLWITGWRSFLRATWKSMESYTALCEWAASILARITLSASMESADSQTLSGEFRLWLFE